MENVIRNNREKSRYEMDVEGKTVLCDYELRGSDIALMGVFVPKELEGRGIASRFVNNLFQLFKEENSRIIPVCSYVIAYMKRHPEDCGLLSDNYDKNKLKD